MEVDAQSTKINKCDKTQQKRVSPEATGRLLKIILTHVVVSSFMQELLSVHRTTPGGGGRPASI